MRKRWTAKTEITDSLLKFREKRKWQIALRRYVIEKNKSSYYAPFFGLDSANFRKWIETQFDSSLNWENFSIAWQFDHILPITYFDFSNENELRLCWNFVNISIEKTNSIEKKVNSIDIIAAKSYFSSLYEHTSYSICQRLVQKIEALEGPINQTIDPQISFLAENKDLIQTLSNLDSAEFDQLNAGIPVTEILALKELINRFGNA